MKLQSRLIGFAGAAVLNLSALVAADIRPGDVGTVVAVVHEHGHQSSAVSPEGMMPDHDEIGIVLTGPDGVETTVSTTLGMQVSFDLPRTGEVRVDCESDHWWSPGAVISREQPTTELILIASGTIRGSIVTASDSPIAELSLRFVPVGADELQLVRDDGTSEWGPKPEQRHGEARCEVVDGSSFECVLPVGSFQMRIRTEGLASKFLWNFEVEAQTPVELGAVRLDPAATLAGRLDSVSGEEIPEDCALFVVLEGESTNSAHGANRIQAELSGDGRFQIRGIDAGVYTLVAGCRGYAVSEIHRIHIASGRDIMINDPVMISPAFNLDGNIIPPLSPEGLRWRVVLTDQDRRSRARFVVTADDVGFWKIESIQSGKFNIEVQTDTDPPSMRFHAGEVHVRPDPPPALVDVELVPVHGVVLFGDEPINATVTFGLSVNPYRTVPYIAATTDGAGEFETWLSDPRWEEGVLWPWPIIVESADPDLHVERFIGVRKPTGGGKVATIKIQIPNTVLSGRVIDNGDRPIENARVLAEVIASREHEDKNWYGPVGSAVRDDSAIVTDPDGVFELIGLPEGRIRVHAMDDGGRESAPQFVNLKGGVNRDDVVLRIEDLRDVTVLVDSGGQPVARATLDVRAQGSVIAKTTGTNEAGVATTAISADEEHPVVFLSILPPGRCLATAAFRLPERGEPYVVSIPSTECGGIEILLPPGGFDPSLLILNGEGGSFTTFRLDSWARANLPADRARTLMDAVIAEEPFVVPRIAPGFYSACLFSSRESYNAFLASGIAGPGECLPVVHLAPFGSVEFDFTRN